MKRRWPPALVSAWVLTVLPVTVGADDSPWSGDAALGFIKTSGTHNSTTLNFKGNLEWKSGPWDNLANAQATYASSAHQSTADSYLFGDKLNRDFDGGNYAFGSLDYVNDHFAGIVESFSEAAGLGRHFVRTSRQQLDADLGLGLSQQRPAGGNAFKDQLIGVFDLAYLWNIAPQSHFKQTLHVEVGQDNTFVDPLTELKFDIYGNLYATLDYEVRYNTTVPQDSVHTNTIASVNFGYNFGK